MYLFTFNEAQGEKFLGLAKTIINTDGKFSEDEQFIFDRIQQELGMTTKDNIVEFTKGDSLDVFDSYQAKKTVC